MKSPYEQEFPCQVCGKHVDVCECSACPTCGVTGRPECYHEKHMVWNLGPYNDEDLDGSSHEGGHQ